MRAGFHSIRTSARPGASGTAIIAFRYLVTVGGWVCVLRVCVHAESRTAPRDKAKEERTRKNYLISKIYRLVGHCVAVVVGGGGGGGDDQCISCVYSYFVSVWCRCEFSFTLHSYANTRLAQFYSPRRKNESKITRFTNRLAKHTRREGNG